MMMGTRLETPDLASESATLSAIGEPAGPPSLLQESYDRSAPHHSAMSNAAVARKENPNWVWVRELRDDVSLSHADLPVLACCAVSGLCDSVAFSAASVFVSMQTGNTVFLALGAAYLPAGQPLLWLKALTSLVCFWLGCLLFSNTRHLHARRKLTLSMSFFIQSVLIFISAALGQAGAVPAFGGSQLSDAIPRPVDTDMKILVPLALLAVQSGGSIVSSRILGFNEVPTNVLTSLYCDLLSDPKLLAPLGENPKRNRRAVAILVLLGGAVAGGWLQRSRAGMTAALWIAGGIKFVIAIAWLGWKSKPDSNTDDKV